MLKKIICITVLIFNALLSIVYAQPNHPTNSLFASDDTLFFHIKSDLRNLLNDKYSNPSYHTAELIWNENQKEAGIPLKVKVRGNFRKLRQNCYFPPLLLNFEKEGANKGVFDQEDKLKLVTRCKTDEYVLREYTIYKIYNLLAKNSFQVKLTSVTFLDSEGKMKPDSQLAFLLEDEDKLAARLGLDSVANVLYHQSQMDISQMATLSVFEYMIGNTDWSVPYRQNIKIFKGANNIGVPIPYDFDHSGLMRAYYAMPSDALGLKSTLERMYRGLGYDRAVFQEVFDKFKKAKPEIYALYENNPGFNSKYVKFVLKFLDSFYETIEDENAVAKEFLAGDSKPNVHIKGLK